MVEQQAFPPRHGRKHAIPPMPTWPLGPIDLPEGWIVLLDRDDNVAAELWLFLRAALRWADTPALKRGHLPPRAVALGIDFQPMPELADAAAVATMLRCTPAEVSADELAEACRSIAEWSARHSHFPTAAAFSEAAAKIKPDEAGLSTYAGASCRRAGYLHRASLWYVRGFRLAVRTGNPLECIRAQLGYGKLLLEQGKGSEARRFFQRAGRRAHHIGRRPQAAAAYHDLFTIAAEELDAAGALEPFTRALRLYPVHHRQLPALAYDFSFFLLRLRLYSKAESILGSTIPLLQSEDHLLIAWATSARLSALLNSPEQCDRAVAEVDGRRMIESGFAAAASIHLAEAARALARWEDAERRAEMTLEIARRRGNALIEADALLLLSAIRGRTPPPPEASFPDGYRIDALVRELRNRLRRWKPRTSP